MKLVKNRTLMRTPCSCRLSCFCLNSNNFTGFVISNDNISITGEQHFRAVRLLFAIQPHSRPPGRRLFHHLCPAAVRTFRRSPPRQVILRLPPHITLTPVNLTVQVVALVFRQLKNMLSVAQLRFQQVTDAVVKVFNPPPVPELQRLTSEQDAFILHSEIAFNLIDIGLHSIKKSFVHIMFVN
ncbi:hypothetical protein XV54_002622 [Salmonella enterica subsp. enterica]|nr:hypothetical protein [Salmonella enterica subsp. enterica serovar Lerum]